MVAAHNCELNVWENSAENVENNDSCDMISMMEANKNNYWQGLVRLNIASNYKQT